ncbi:MAG: hypothetical protein WC280_03775 [Patescibacteria group bacterium]
MKANVLFFRPAVFLLSLVLTVACQKDFENTPKRAFEPTNYDNPTVAPVLKYSNSALKSVEGNIITSGDAISVNSSYVSSFWLDPAEGIVARGSWEISNDLGEVIFQRSNANGIDITLPTGNYTLRVSGTYQGEDFLYNNIVINSQVENQGGDDVVVVPPNPIRSLTSPVSLSNLNVTSSNVSVTITISKEEYYSQTDWFHLYRINGQDFKTKQAVSQTADSISFVITAPKTNNTLVEFNGAYNDGSIGGVWMTPSATGSILYSGGDNFFSYRIRIVGSEVELTTNSTTATVLISTNSQTTIPTIPGEAGDGIENDHTVRWSGLKHFIKTEVNNPSIAYKIGSGSWTFVQLTESASPGYWEFTLPQGSTGTVYFYWGIGTNVTNFVPSTSEMIESMYYSADAQICAKNI